MAPPTDDQLKLLKEKRANAKRRVTITYNLLEPKASRGVLKESDKVLHNKLLQEYTLFEAAYDNYAEALETRECVLAAGGRYKEKKMTDGRCTSTY